MLPNTPEGRGHTQVASRPQLLPKVALMVKNLPAMQETWVSSLGREDSMGEEWQPTPVFLPREPHRQRSIVGSKELNTTEET